MSANVRPALSALQLDTGFARIPGDVACAETYSCEVELIRVPGAAVTGIVRGDPSSINIAPFEEALANAKGEVIATSCGFLSYWQAHLQALTERPFVSSSLIGLPDLALRYAPGEIMIVTFDAAALGPDHMCGCEQYLTSVIGLPRDNTLRRAIETDDVFEPARVEAELRDLIKQARGPKTKHIVFECTNLPPYTKAVRAATGLQAVSYTHLTLPTNREV